MGEPKWHYFDANEEVCWFKSPFTRKRFKTVLCGPLLNEIQRHTEFKNRVTCKRCHSRLVWLDRGVEYE